MGSTTSKSNPTESWVLSTRSELGNDEKYYQDLYQQIYVSLDIDIKRSSLPKASKLNITDFNTEWKSFMEDDTVNSQNNYNTFMAKWLLHQNNNIKDHVLRILLIAMKDPPNRSKIIQHFVDILLQRDVQKPAYLLKLLQAIKHILYHWKYLFISDQGNTQKQYYDIKDVDSYRKQISELFSWQSKVDAIGLVLLCHYDIEVRVQALQFLNEIHETYNICIDKLPVIQQNEGINDHLHIVTIGSLLFKVSLYDVILECISSTYIAGSFSQSVSKLIISFVGIIETTIIDKQGKNAENGTRLSILSKYIVNAKSHETILCTVETILHLLSFMPYSRDKAGWATKKEWNSSAIIRNHWISLHCLLFSIIGAGLSNPFNVSSESDLRAFEWEQENIESKSFKVIKNKFEIYLYEFWGCLHEEVVWIPTALYSILQQTNWESMNIVLNTLYRELTTVYQRKRRGKNIVDDVASSLRTLVQSKQFAASMYIGGDEMVQLCLKFVDNIKKQAFTPSRIEKKRWWSVQINLVQFYGYLLRSISNIGAHKHLRDEIWWFPVDSKDKTDKLLIQTRANWFRKKCHVSYQVQKDNMPYIKKAKREERFLAFKWLLMFLADVEGNDIPYVDPLDLKESEERKKEVRFSVFMALQYLLNTGIIIPNDRLLRDQYIVTLLRGRKGIEEDFPNYSLATNPKNKCILFVFIEAEREGFELLTPLLSFQFESLISFYIEQSETYPTAQHLFGKSIINVIKSNEPYNKTNWRITRSIGSGFLENIFHYAHKLLFLGFKMITDKSVNVQYNGYLLLKLIAEILVGGTLVEKLDKLKFRNAVVISEYFAASYPMIASLFFRVCIQNMQPNIDNAEWILSVLKPWTAIIHLHCYDSIVYNTSIESHAEIQRKYHSDKLAKAPIPQLSQLTAHETFATLARLLDATSIVKKAGLNEEDHVKLVAGYVLEQGINDLSQDLLKMILVFYSFSLIHLVESNWMELSHAYPADNLLVVLDFVRKTKQERARDLQLERNEDIVLKHVLYAIMEGFYVNLVQDQQRQVPLSIVLKMLSYSLHACEKWMDWDRNKDSKFFDVGRRISLLCAKLTYIYDDEEEIKKLALECWNQTKSMQL